MAFRRPPSSVTDKACGNQHGTNAGRSQRHEPEVERAPQQVENHETGEKETRQRDRAPAIDKSRHRSTRHM